MFVLVKASALHQCPHSCLGSSRQALETVFQGMVNSPSRLVCAHCTLYRLAPNGPPMPGPGHGSSSSKKEEGNIGARDGFEVLSCTIPTSFMECLYVS